MKTNFDKERLERMEAAALKMQRFHRLVNAKTREIEMPHHDLNKRTWRSVATVMSVGKKQTKLKYFNVTGTVSVTCVFKTDFVLENAIIPHYTK